MSQQTYDEFLKKRHAAMNTPREIIDEFVQKATNGKIKEMKRLIMGESSEVYDATLEDETQIIVRISSNNYYFRFIPEKWAINKCEKHNIPVPEILLIEQFMDGRKTKEICIEKKLNGEELVSLAAKINEDTLHKMLYKTGEVLSDIHSIPVDGFGILDDQGKGEYKTNEEYILGMRLKDKTRDETAAAKYNMLPFVEQAHSLLSKYLYLYSDAKSMLLHGDFTPQHVFFHNDQVTGIIDFENVAGGDPIRDIAIWNFYYNIDFPTKYLLAGYKNKALLENNFELKLHVYSLHLGLGFLHYYDDTSNITGVETVRKIFISDFQYFQNL